jgi:uncharacterized protein with FMN-binding domain
LNRDWLFGVVLSLVALVGLALSGCGPKTYNDGAYKGISQADGAGYTIAEVTVQKDKITAVKLTDVTELGAEKDYGTDPWPQAKEANTEMAKRFVGKKDTKGIDAYSGATGSSKKYIEAVSFALEKGRKTPTVKSTYFDGTFFGKSRAGEQGYGVAWVTIKGDKITAVKLDDVTEKNVFKDWITYLYPKALEAKDAMQKSFVEKNSATVDAFVGATSGSTKWMEAVANALANAKVR